ncbi:hypothetical protein T492DRAFT_863724 [Pavlovales sp. CCMP2436]|nr:hypothetical protein T492DRAFT_863724 [Pavlovales sp. CCMP2436]
MGTNAGAGQRQNERKREVAADAPLPHCQISKATAAAAAGAAALPRGGRVGLRTALASHAHPLCLRYRRSPFGLAAAVVVVAAALALVGSKLSLNRARAGVAEGKASMGPSLL